MSRLLFICALLLVSRQAFSQNKEYNTWCFGQGYGLDFNQGAPPSVITTSIGTTEGCASISNRWSGALLFYTDGVTVYDNTHTAMANGSGLQGHFSAAQSAMIIPMPGDSMKYYIFTADQEGYMGGNTGIHYSIVNMALNAGAGDVTTKNVSIQTTAAECMTAVKHPNGRDYWVLTHGLKNNVFYAWLVTPTGVANAVTSTVGIDLGQGGTFLGLTLGNLKASPNGRQLAMTCYAGSVELFDFDPCSGTVSNALTLKPFSPNTAWAYGISFSPDNTKLYFNRTGQLWQYQLQSGNPTTIQNSGTVINDANLPGLTLSDGALQLGPDGKIYIRPAFVGYWLGVISSPNSAGQNCSFSANAFTLPTRNTTNWIGLPNNIDARNTSLPVTITSSTSTSFCQGGSTVLSASAGYSSYRWSTGDTTRSITVQTAGTYTVTIGTSSGCGGGIDSILVRVFPTPQPAIDPAGTTYICQGDSTTLSCRQTFTSYRWSTGATTRSITVRQAGTYTLTVTDSNGCVGTISATVGVNPLPVPTISGLSSFCSGDTITLSGQPGFNSYQWSTGSMSRSILVSRAGTYSLTVTDANGCRGTVSKTVTMNSLPVPTISGLSSFCSGDTITLSGQPGFNRYQWSTGDTTRVIPVWKSGTYSLTVTDSNGCKGNVSKTVTMNSLPVPTISGSLSVCEGDKTTLSGEPGYNRYLWSTGDTTRSIAVGKAGTYTLTVIDANGCKGTVSATVRVNPVPVPTITARQSFCEGESTMLVGQPGFAAYLWSTGEHTDSISISQPGT
jgi:hypothetical protein